MTDDLEALAELPFNERMRRAHRAVNLMGKDADTCKLVLATALWPTGAPELTKERQDALATPVIGKGGARR